MTPLSQLSIEGERASWRVARVCVTERLHTPTRVIVIASATDGVSPLWDIDASELFGKRARVSWETEDSDERAFEGVVAQVELAGRHYVLSIEPPIAALAYGADHRVFMDQDAVAIVKTVLAEQGLDVDVRVSKNPEKRAQCVQMFESNLDFVSRLLADEGIAWYPDRGNASRLIVTDHGKGFDEIDNPLPVREEGGLNAGASIRLAQLKRRVVAEQVTLRDFDFRAPSVELKGEASDGNASGIEHYEFPGGFRDSGRGRALASMRLEEQRVGGAVLTCETNARGLSPGRILHIDAERDGLRGAWLLVSVEHDLVEPQMSSGGEAHYRARFSAIPSDIPFRPARRAPPARGVEHATTTGPGGMDIHTESLARVKASLRWDRRGPKDAQSSAWTRTVQPPISGGFFLPRVGWEVLMGFSSSSAMDAPLVLGRLYNGEATPPSGLPSRKVETAFGTLTTPGGGGANRVAMSDGKGQEAMTFHASKDMNERTENDKVTSIAASETASVGGNRTLIVGQVHQLGISGAQTHSVGGSRSVNVNANMAITAASESVAIGGSRSFTIGGDYATSCASLTRLVSASKTETDIEHQTRQVTGASTVLVGAAWNAVGGTHASVSVSGASAEAVGGPKSVTCGKYTLMVKGALTQNFGARKVTAGGNVEEGFGAAALYSIAGGATIKGSDVIFKAKGKLTIKASGITISMTPGSVKISGKFAGSVASSDDGDETYG